MSFSLPEKTRIDPLPSLYKFHTKADVLRLDIIHPVISGNKWFKLKPYLEDMQQTGKKIILTFGGAFSNHIVATAAAANIAGFQSVGIIRGEKPPQLSPTLLDAISYGMDLHFISRENYKTGNIPAAIYKEYPEDDIYIVPAGGYGEKGMLGAKKILSTLPTGQYSHILAACGSGTMLAGLLASALPHQKLIGISALKNNFSLQNEIRALLPSKTDEGCHLVYDYHFGGYAKWNNKLISFMNDWYRKNEIPSDFVYTAKLFYALNDLAQKKYFTEENRILAIHSGGLQGNRSLPNGTLIF